MLCLSGFELYSLWVPLTRGRQLLYLNQEESKINLQNQRKQKPAIRCENLCDFLHGLCIKQFREEINCATG